jgi:hypothetical protein
VSVPVHKLAFKHLTVLIWTNILKIFQIEGRPIVVHRNAIPTKQPWEFATVYSLR